MKRSTVHIQKLAVVCAMILGLFLSNVAYGQQKIQVLLAWTLQAQYLPLYIALENGYFATEGLDVSISSVQGGPRAISIIAENSDFQFGLVPYDTLVKAVAQGMPVKAIFGILQTSPMGIFSRGSSPIREPADLEGKKLASAPGWGITNMLTPLFNINKIDAAQVTMINPGNGTRAALLLQKHCDAITGYVTGNDAASIERAGVPVYSFLYADFGVNTLSDGVVVNRDFLNTHQDIVKGFLRAFTKALHDAQHDPAAAVDIFLQANPEYQEQRDAYLKGLQATLRLLHTQNTTGKPLGWMSEKDWEQTQDILFEYGGLKKKLPLETYYTNDYIPTEE